MGKLVTSVQRLPPTHAIMIPERYDGADMPSTPKTIELLSKKEPLFNAANTPRKIPRIVAIRIEAMAKIAVSGSVLFIISETSLSVL